MQENARNNWEKCDLEHGDYGLCSDLHMGSLYFNADAFRAFLTNLQSRGVKRLFILGDLIEYNDLVNPLVSEVNDDTYLGRVKAGLELLFSFDFDVEVIEGNHEADLKGYNEVFYNEVRKFVGDRGGIWHDSVGFEAFGLRMTHDAKDSAVPKAFDNKTVVVSGHTHFGVADHSEVDPNRVDLVLGGFRDHFREKLLHSGAILSVGSHSEISLEVVGELSQHQKDILNALRGMDFAVDPVRLDQQELSPEREAYAPFLKDFFAELRVIDPEAVCWVTGSLAVGDFDTQMSNAGARFVLRTNPNDPRDIELASDGSNKDVYLPQSDLDLECVSSKLTKANVRDVLQRVVARHSNFNKVVPRIDVCVYNRDELRLYENLVNSERDVHNYLLYKILLAAKGCIDDKSEKWLIQARNRMILFLEAQLGSAMREGHCDGLTLDDCLKEIATIRVSIGYVTGMKPFKRDLKTRPSTAPNLYFDDYFLAYLHSISARVPQSICPDKLPNAHSFKVIFPEVDFAKKPEYVDDAVVIAPPLSAYQNQVHMGQLLNTSVAHVFDRARKWIDGIPNGVARAVPVHFQASGKYWDRPFKIDQYGETVAAAAEGEDTFFLGADDVDEIVAANMAKVAAIIDGFGINIDPHLSDRSPESIGTLQVILDRLASFGLLHVEGDDLYLRLEAALKMFGGENAFANLFVGGKPELNNLGLSKLTPSSPGKKIGTVEVTIFGRKFKLYPAISGLALPYVDKMHASRRNAEVVCGINIATQIIITHAVLLHVLDHSTPEINATGFQLITTTEGKRMSRTGGNTMFLSFDAGLKAPVYYCFGEDGETRVNSETLDTPEKFFALQYGLLKMCRVKNSPKYNPDHIQEGKRVFSRLTNLKSLFANVDTNNYVDLPGKFIAAFEKREVGCMINIYNQAVSALWNKKGKIDRGELNVDSLATEYNAVLNMHYILFGEGYNGALGFVDSGVAKESVE